MTHTMTTQIVIHAQEEIKTLKLLSNQTQPTSHLGQNAISPTQFHRIAKKRTIARTGV